MSSRIWECAQKPLEGVSGTPDEESAHAIKNGSAGRTGAHDAEKKHRRIQSPACIVFRPALLRLFTAGPPALRYVRVPTRRVVGSRSGFRGYRGPSGGAAARPVSAAPPGFPGLRGRSALVRLAAGGWAPGLCAARGPCEFVFAAAFYPRSIPAQGARPPSP